MRVDFHDLTIFRKRTHHCIDIKAVPVVARMADYIDMRIFRDSKPSGSVFLRRGRLHAVDVVGRDNPIERRQLFLRQIKTATVIKDIRFDAF